MNRRLLGIRWAGVCALGLLCSGCPNPNTYGTPRTTPTGKISHSVAAEAWGFKVADGETGATGSAMLPTAPTYTLRVGLADTVDIGARVSNLSSFGADVKWNFLKSEFFDMAVDPSFQFFYFSAGSASVNVVYLNAPLMIGINAGDSVSIIPIVGVTYGFASASVDTADESESASGTTGPMFRGGLGFDFRLTPKFAMHPEISVLKTLNGPDEDSSLLYMIGLGFNFGNLPKYGAEPVEK
jgi:hypothetical protein